MTKHAIIEHTIKVINQLPTEKAQEISDFADLLIKKYEDQIILNGIKKITSDSETFEFLLNEEDLYSESDIKKRPNE